MPEILKSIKIPEKAKKRDPLWKGPEDRSSLGGVTFSMLSRFLQCRERFRLYTIEGLRPAEGFNHYIEYGQMWHVCEETLAKSNSWPSAEKELRYYSQDLCKQYPTQIEQIDKWYNVCKVQFPIYVEYWSQHPDVQQRTPLLQEQVFNIPYTLPSGRVVILRGKFDSVDIIGVEDSSGIWLQENKTKSQIDEEKLKQQLSFDLQTMMYLTALQTYLVTEHPILGVRYNVIRRPLSGGRGTIVQHKPSKSNPDGESKASYYARLAQYIKDEPETYFARWKCEVSQEDIAVFRQQCLDPILQNLCEWYDDRKIAGFKGFGSHLHWRHPYGVRNHIDEGGSSDVDNYLATGSEVGLQRVETLFSELG